MFGGFSLSRQAKSETKSNTICVSSAIEMLELLLERPVFLFASLELL